MQKMLLNLQQQNDSLKAGFSTMIKGIQQGDDLEDLKVKLETSVFTNFNNPNTPYEEVALGNTIEETDDG